ncbi:hypothetical protein AAFC00_003938 [Neodothiora populina]|uniref:Arabinosidase n=1 Tax=Neodothiora populina TaxID=2781224 RepID=A0ABR3PIC9_9PEZI
MRGLTNIIALLSLTGLVSTVTAAPTEYQSLDFEQLNARADSSLVGYLGTFFLGDEPSVYFYLSNGNNALSFRALNGGKPILVPSGGTGGVRDPSLITGGGDESGSKWYIIGTDLDIAKTTWDASQRNGSLSIYIWESTDLVNWSAERLVKVENDDAGMVWAPDAIWDPAENAYLVHWASKFYAADDVDHSGPPTNIVIRYAYTIDFVSFSSPATLIDTGSSSIIDLNILPLESGSTNSYARFIKNETATNVYMEISTTGLNVGANDAWTRPGGPDAIIRSGVEGPAAYLDNMEDGLAHLLLDYFSDDGYRPFENADPATSDVWTDSDRSNFPSNLRHGSVLGVDQGRYDALNQL